MKKIAKSVSTLMVLGMLGMTMLGCASKPAAAEPAPAAAAQPAAEPRDPNMPLWINDFPPEDALWGIGTAKQSTDNMSMTMAENRARVSISQQLSSMVQIMITDYTRDAGTAGSQASISLQESVSRSMSEAKLTGARPIQKWKGPDGTWWYLVEYKKADALNQASNIFATEEEQYAEFKTAQALDMMDAQLANNKEKPPVVDYGN
ncbi:MAG: LPP20 family lipoprotein [Treponema sp.]|jgi:hypothetical protein|nr:LPP20 family lipoprotein [Treponema sp.]